MADELSVREIPAKDFGAITSRQLARLLRAAGALGLGRDLQRELEAAVIVGAEQAFHQDVERGQDFELKNCELKIRQLVSIDASWPKLKPFAWKRFRLQGTDASAGRLVETVFVSGTIHETLAVLAVLNEEGYAYYFQLDRKFREHLAFSLWKVGKTESLEIFLLANDANFALTAIEWLFLYYHYARHEDEAKQFMIFKEHYTDLVSAAETFGPRLCLHRDKLLFDGGSLAIQMGFLELGAASLKKIGPQAKEYADALQVLMVLASDRDNPASRTYFRQIDEATSWRGKIDLMQKYMRNCRERIGASDIRRPALNELISDPLKLVPNLPVSWSAASLLVAKNADLAEVLPGLFNLYRVNAIKFHSPALDAAIWEPVIYDMTVNTPFEQYWRGVALLHQYVNFGKATESTLWMAKQDVEEAADRAAYPVPMPWVELHQSVLRAVAKSPHLQERRRQEMLRQLKIAADPGEISLQEVEEYLSQSDYQPYSVLQQIQAISQNKQAHQLESRVIQRKSEATHLTNNDLSRLWAIGNYLNDFDLCWRVATVLNGRGVLDQRVKTSWMISGERRADYPFFVPEPGHVHFCKTGFNALGKKLCHAMLKVGGTLPELLAALDERARVVKFPAPAADSFEFKVERVLNKIKWVPNQKYCYHLSYDGLLSSGVQLPGFVDVMPNNLWSYLFVRLAERFGLNAWGWRLSQLHAQVEELLPKIASHTAMSKLSAKVARWLKALTPEQRSAWQDLVTLHNKLSDEQGVEVISNFLCRLTMAIHPAHVQALQSLRTMRAPVAVIWNLETWLASGNYSEIRRHFGTINRVPVPINLRKLLKIHLKTPPALGVESE